MTDEMMAPSSSATSDAPYAASEEVAADALQEPGPAPLDVGQQARHGTYMGTGDAGGHLHPRTRQEAEAALDYTAAYCRNCPIRERCVEDRCAIWWAEKAALEVLRRAEDIPVVAGVPLQGSLA